MNNEKRVAYIDLITECAALRRKLGKSQREVGIDMDCSPSFVSRFENGEKRDCSMLTWYINNGLFEFMKADGFNV